MFSVTKYYKTWFVFSGTLMAASIVLLFVWGLRPGIDFRGGSLAELEFTNEVKVPEIRDELLQQDFEDVVIQSTGDKRVIIKTETLEEEEIKTFKKVLQDSFGENKEIRFETIGPTISRELSRRAYWQIALVCLGILLYVAYAFRKIGRDAKRKEVSPWRLGVAAIIALIHDILITVGFFAVLGKAQGVEVDSLFITALLTILGFSVHDTIVVFDRIRENIAAKKFATLAENIDHSINSTLARSINTSSTLIFVLIAMLLFGGPTVFHFVLALLVGVTVGTYSSIFIASPLLYVWSKI